MAAMMPLSALVLGQMTPMDIMKSKSEAWQKYTSSHMTTGPECAAPSPLAMVDMSICADSLPFSTGSVGPMSASMEWLVRTRATTST